VTVFLTRGSSILPLVCLLGACAAPPVEIPVQSDMTALEARNIAILFSQEKYTPPKRKLTRIKIDYGQLPGYFSNLCHSKQQGLIEELDKATSWRNIGVGPWGGSSFASRKNISTFISLKSEMLFKTGNFKDAIEYADKALSIARSARSDVAKLAAYQTMAIMYARIGETEQAESNFEKGRRLMEGRTRGIVPLRNTDYGQVFVNMESASMAKLRDDTFAEEYFLKRLIELTKFRFPKNFYVDRDYIAAALADNLLRQRRFVEAELIVIREINNATYRMWDLPILSMRVLAESLLAQQRFEDSEFAAIAAVRMHYKDCSLVDGLSLVEARRTLLKILSAQGKWDEIRHENELISQELRGRPERYRQLYSSNPDLFLARINGGLDSNLLQDIDRAIDQSESTQKSDLLKHELQIIKGLVLHRMGQHELALNLLQESVEPYIQLAAKSNSATKTGGADVRVEFFRLAFMDFLSSPQGKAAANNLGLNVREELFRIASSMPSGRVQKSVQASSARLSINNPNIEDLIRKVQDFDEQVLNTVDLIAYLESAPASQVNYSKLIKLRKNLVSINQAKNLLSNELETRFPEYAQLINPGSPTIKEIRELLLRDEVLVKVYTTSKNTYVWAISRSSPVSFHVTDVGRSELEAVVNLLKRALDPQGVTTLQDIPDFDVLSAYGLYKKIFFPVMREYKNHDNILFVAQGPLSYLPISLLPITKPDLGPAKDLYFANYRNISWLAKSHAVTTLPSVSTLVSLRLFSKPRANQKPFIGFGDPVFEQESQESQESTCLSERGLKRKCKDEANSQVALRSKPSTRGLESASLKDLPRLPDTRDEILSIAKVLGADIKTDVFLGIGATEKNVKEVDLSQYRVISFATHGLVPGDLNGLMQPALALSSPDVTGDQYNDGLLTMGEVLGLNLNADWVVLSACNTAAAEGSGMEAISGLGRAFFFAGAKALLVSNWPVHSEATTDLMKTVFESQAENDQISRAEALQRARLHLISEGVSRLNDQDQFSYAHPIFWAPFTIVGDGR
jgi:CHAT domain-containing protein